MRNAKSQQRSLHPHRQLNASSILTRRLYSGSGGTDIDTWISNGRFLSSQQSQSKSSSSSTSDKRAFLLCILDSAIAVVNSTDEESL